MSDRPKEIHMVGTRLHRDGGMAVQFRDGWGIWKLNGVTVSQEIAETPKETLSSDLILKEKNAQVRAEIARKIGVERLAKDLNAETVDREGGYELLLLDLGDNQKRPYLKMKNPSVDLVHIEGVQPGITTVSAALTWRNKTETRPVQLS